MTVIRYGGDRSSILSILVSVSIAVAGCGALQPEATPTDVVVGHYVWGAEVNVFSPCGSDQEYWVDAAPEVMQTMRERYVTFQLAPYTAVFARVRGEVGPVLDCGFCEDYDGSFHVTELIQMALAGPQDCVTE